MNSRVSTAANGSLLREADSFRKLEPQPSRSGGPPNTLSCRLPYGRSGHVKTPKRTGDADNTPLDNLVFTGVKSHF